MLSLFRSSPVHAEKTTFSKCMSPTFSHSQQKMPEWRIYYTVRMEIAAQIKCMWHLKLLIDKKKESNGVELVNAME